MAALDSSSASASQRDAPDQDEIIPRGSKKVAAALQSVKVFEPSEIYGNHMLDSVSKQNALAKMKSLLHTLNLLTCRYVSLEDFKIGLVAGISPEQGASKKTKKRYSFKNPDNLKQLLDESLVSVPGGGLRPLLQEYEIATNSLLSSRLAKVKKIKHSYGPPPSHYTPQVSSRAA